MVTLYILKNIDKMIFKKKQTIFNIKTDNIEIISSIYEMFQRSQISVKNIEINSDTNNIKINLLTVHDRRIVLDEVIKELSKLKNIISIDYLN